MAKSADRQDRLAAALRANLKRRKAQDRAKAQTKAQPRVKVPAADEGAASCGADPRPNMAQKGE